jgi:hypothetical protein
MFDSLLATTYFACNWIFHAGHAGIRILFEGFWLGLLPDSAVDVISQRSYGGGTEYTRDGYLDSGLQFWEEMAVQRYFPPASRVLVASAGGGRELIGLFRAGYRADGFECSAPMVKAGNRALASRGIQSDLRWAPPSSVPDWGKIYEAAIIGWNGYTYISHHARRIDFLKDLATQLAPGAPILLSGAIRTGNSLPAIWIPRVANVIRSITFRPQVFTTGATFPGRPRHEFTRGQLEAELKEAGLSPIAFWKWGVFGAMVAIKPAHPISVAQFAGTTST